MAEEEPDAIQFKDKERPVECEWPKWARTYLHAWVALRDDRFYGSMGGMGRIYYSAISRYAADHGIPMYPFLTFIFAIDAEFVEWNAEQSKTKTE